MKKILLPICFFIAFIANAQVKTNLSAKDISKLSADEYQKLKESGQLNIITPKQTPMPFSTQRMNLSGKKFGKRVGTSGEFISGQRADCNECYQAPNQEDIIVPFTNGIAPEYRNDDGSSPLIPLPFVFNLYGTEYNSFYINNNGNISFNAPYFTFSASGFPSADFVMIAPFWGDVDTRNTQSNVVYYKITDTYAIIKWHQVGYYNEEADKLNSFMLIISNGLDPIIPDGNNVSFCYGDMQWTTGSASGGNNGFGGIPATVGANLGDGTSYIQFGRFDHPGSDYDGAFGEPDGISWLDFQNFNFSTSSDNNIPPIITGIGVCDTVVVCKNDVVQYSIGYVSPEVTQITTIDINTGGVPDITVSDIINGNSASATLTINGTNANLGIHEITITGTDDGTPAQTTTITLLVNIVDFQTSAVSTNATCAGNDGIITLSGLTQDVVYEYSINGDAGPFFDTGTFNNLTPGNYQCVIRTPGGCSFDTVIVISNPLVPLGAPTGNGAYCDGTSVNINVTEATNVTYSWTGPNSFTSTTSDISIVATPGTAGQYCLTITTDEDCVGTPECVNIAVENPSVIAGADISACGNEPIQLDGSFAGSATGVVWSGGSGTFSNTNIQNPTYTPSAADIIAGTVTLTISALAAPVCPTATDQVVINLEGTPTVNAGSDQTVCEGTVINLAALLGGSANTGTWSGGSGTYSNQNNAQTTYTPTASEAGIAVNFTFTTNSAGICPAAVDVVQVTFANNPTASISGSPVIGINNTVCPGGEISVLLNGNAPYTLTYSLPDGTQQTYTSTSPINTFNIPNIQPGTYTLQSIVDNLGCSALLSSSATAVGYELTKRDSINFETCSNQDGFIKLYDVKRNSSDYSAIRYEWLWLNDITQIFPRTDSIGGLSATVSGSTQFRILLTDTLTGCFTIDTLILQRKSGLLAGISANPTSGVGPLEVTFTNGTTGVPAIRYEWTFDDGSPIVTTTTLDSVVHTFELDTVYKVVLKAFVTDNCFDTASIIIDVRLPDEVDPPNIFTPNGDNNNNVFRVNPAAIRNFECIIFDRWGRKVAEFTDPVAGWNGEGADTGVYYYVMNYEKRKTQEKKTLTGFVQLLR